MFNSKVGRTELFSKVRQVSHKENSTSPMDCHVP